MGNLGLEELWRTVSRTCRLDVPCSILVKQNNSLLWGEDFAILAVAEAEISPLDDTYNRDFHA